MKEKHLPKSRRASINITLRQGNPRSSGTESWITLARDRDKRDEQDKLNWIDLAADIVLSNSLSWLTPKNGELFIADAKA